ncbi:MAG: metallophosphoesterase, partial [Candidatus Methanomethylophilaceae archaeon]|nr:metallophosphoesterase [Candidatus Methanomethylophilaceae archaeon]
MFEITRYTLETAVSESATFALLADIHDRIDESLILALEAEAPDFVLMPGDIMERPEHQQTNGLRLLTESAKRFPTFYSFGNHEFGMKEDRIPLIQQTGAVLLRNESVSFGPFRIGGTDGALRISEDTLSFLPRFEQEEGFRILLCHDPGFYPKYLRPLHIPLIVSGHAHGGQIRLFGQGLFAPGQGF